VQISLEKIIEMVTREVINELINKGFHIENNLKPGKINGLQNAVFEPDMSGFITPLLTENLILSLNGQIQEVHVPAKTIVTPGAKNVLKNRNITVIYKS